MPSTTPYAPLLIPNTYLPSSNAFVPLGTDSKTILVKNCGSKYENPNVVLYALVPAARRPLERTISESELNPEPLCFKKKLFGFTLPITGVIVGE